MIRSITVVNHVGDQLELKLTDPYETGIAVISVDGLGPGEANIVTTEYATNDGAMYNSSRLSTRNIVLNFKLLPVPTIEQVRLKVYRYFPVKKPVWLIVETDSRRVQIQGYVESNVPEIFSDWETVQISILCPDPYFQSLSGQSTDFSGYRSEFEFNFYNGICETANSTADKTVTTVKASTTNKPMTSESGRYVAVKFANSNTASASSLTLSVDGGPKLPIKDRYGQAISTSLVSGVYWLFYSTGSNWVLLSPDNYTTLGRVFSYGPFAMGSVYFNEEVVINYSGEIDAGLTINIEFLGPVENLKIFNVQTTEYMQIDTAKIVQKYGLGQLLAGDKLVITTSKGNKKALFTRGINTYNVINAFDKNISWFQLHNGDNIFAYTVTSGMVNLSMSFDNKIYYEGV